jgi:rhodanese-related sulfurtransferase
MLCLAFGIAWWKRNRYRVRPHEVARWLEQPESAPVVLDVRDRDTYQKSPVQIPRALHVPADALASGAAPPALDPSRRVVAYCT